MIKDYLSVTNQVRRALLDHRKYRDSDTRLIFKVLEYYNVPIIYNYNSKHEQEFIDKLKDLCKEYSYELPFLKELKFDLNQGCVIIPLKDILKLPKFESITRARRKIQEQQPELRATPEVEDARKEEECTMKYHFQDI